MPFTKGHIGYNKGKHISEETRRKMSIAHKNTYENGRMPWFKGKHLTEEHKLNLSKSHKGKPSPLKGHKISQEHKDKIALANKGRKHTPETREHLSKSLRERHRKVVSGRRSQGLLRYYQSHEVWNKGLSWSAEIREKIREGCLISEIGMGPRYNDEIRKNK